MPILKPDSALKSWSRKPSHMQSVRLPWAMVVPNGLSVLARSVSTWIHWWSPDTSANLSMSAWVTSRHPLGPVVWPTNALRSSIPFTVMAMAAAYRRPRSPSRSAPVVPRLRAQRRPQRLPPVLHHGLPVRDEHAVEVELEQRLQGGVEAL